MLKQHDSFQLLTKIRKTKLKNDQVISKTFTNDRTFPVLLVLELTYTHSERLYYCFNHFQNVFRCHTETTPGRAAASRVRPAPTKGSKLLTAAVTPATTERKLKLTLQGATPSHSTKNAHIKSEKSRRRNERENCCTSP